MAGETRGELAEAIAYYALTRALRSVGHHSSKVFWEQKPSSIPVIPDITLGPSPDEPEAILLITACDAPKNFAEKFWRNLGEQFDAKSRIHPGPLVINLIFLSQIKPELIRLTEEISDVTILVDRVAETDSAIPRFLNTFAAKAPPKKEEKLQLVADLCNRRSSPYDPEFSREAQALSGMLAKVLSSKQPRHPGLWQLMAEDFRSRKGLTTEAKITMLRRGVARWSVFGAKLLPSVLQQHLAKGTIALEQTGKTLSDLGVLEEKKSILTSSKGPAYAIPNPDPQAKTMLDSAGFDLRTSLEFFLRAAKNKPQGLEALRKAVESAPNELHAFALHLRQIPTIAEEWHDYVKSRWADLCNPERCHQLLIQCRNDPSLSGAVRVPEGCERRVWIYDHLVALLRAQPKGRNNEYGYNFFVSRFKRDATGRELLALLRRVIAAAPSRTQSKCLKWTQTTLLKSSEPGRRGFQEWLNGEKDLLPVITACFAYALSKALCETRTTLEIPRERYIASHAYSLWNKLLTYPDFEPLAQLIEAAGNGKLERRMQESLLLDIGPEAVQEAGRVQLLAAKSALILWRSAYGTHAKDKKKELGARARTLRFRRNREGVWVNNKAMKLLLVVDGEFSKEDLRYLLESGFDQIFYPDEMGKLTQAIV
jgi:hypothetical protein